MTSQSVIGCLLGTAVGDALGLAYEGLPRQRAAKLLGPPDRFRLFGRWGLVSDDTEHACLVAQSVIASGCDPQQFERQLARRLRSWFLMLPAGIGLATLKACLKLCIGLSPSRSGVRSAGNGAAMRAAILGATIKDRSLMLELVARSSMLTHTDRRAIDGAIAVALAARMSACAEEAVASLPHRFAEELMPLVEQESAAAMQTAIKSVVSGQSTQGFAESIGCGQQVSGFVLHTVPVVLHAWLSHPTEFLPAVQSVIRLGGDADSTAAMVGGIVGARVGAVGLPIELLNQLRDWPRSVSWMTALAQQLAASERSERPIALRVIPQLLRNAAFAGIVLSHGMRRMAPPY